MTTNTNNPAPVAEPASETRAIHVTISVPADWANRLDMQHILEREIRADRWSWNWPAPAPAVDERTAEDGHLAAAPKQQLPEPVAWIHTGYVSTNKGRVLHDEQYNRSCGFKAQPVHALYTADQLRTAIAAERRKTRLLEFKLKERAHPTSEPRDPPEILSSLGFWPDCGCGECYAIHCLGEAQAELSTLRQQLAEAVRERDALRAQVDAAVPAMRDYARRNPRWESWDNGEVEGKMQDPNGVNAWLEQIDAAIAAQGEAKPPGVERELFEGE